MEAEGLDEKIVFNQILETLKSNDMSYDSGQILGSMCTKPLALTIKLYQQFFDSYFKNILK